MIASPYTQFKKSVCEAVMPGVIELLAISIIIGIFNLATATFGTCFVIRNKVDVPIYKTVSARTSVKTLKKTKKSKSAPLIVID